MLRVLQRSMWHFLPANPKSILDHFARVDIPYNTPEGACSEVALERALLSSAQYAELDVTHCSGNRQVPPNCILSGVQIHPEETLNSSF